MNKLVLALALVLSFHGLKAHADKLEDLGTEVEAEEMESFDQKALEDAQRKETAQNEKKTRDLERQIDRLKAENRSIAKRVESQTDRFNRVYKQAREAEALAKKFEAQRDQAKARLDAARSRTQQAQNRLQSANDLKKSLTREIAQQERETRSLKQQLKVAQARLNRAQKDIKNLRRRQRRVTASNRALESKIANIETRAANLEARNFENDLH